MIQANTAYSYTVKKQDDEIRKGSKTNIDTDKEICGGSNRSIGAQQ